MSIVVHNTAVLDGSNPAYTDRLLLGVKLGVANVAGAGAGASVTTAVTFNSPELPASGLYAVSVDAGQPCISTVTSKTATGFSVTLTPYPASATLAAGTFHVTVEA